GLLMFFRGGRNSLTTKLFCVVLSKQHVPFLTAFQNFFLLGGDALAHFDFHLLFFLQYVGHGLHYVLTDRVAVFYKFHFISLDQQIDELMGDAHNLFAAQSHGFSVGSLFPSLAQDQFPVTGELPFHLLEHLLVRDAGAAHLVLVLGKDGANLFVDLILDGDFLHHSETDSRDEGLLVFFFDFDLIVLQKLLNHFGGHMADIVAVQQHFSGDPRLNCELPSVLSRREIRKKHENLARGCVDDVRGFL